MLIEQECGGLLAWASAVIMATVDAFGVEVWPQLRCSTVLSECTKYSLQTLQCLAYHHEHAVRRDDIAL